jgi:hypothetical protein
MHLHEFLSHVHEIVKPKVYLEVGVQHGTSLKLAHAAEVAIGVDPLPFIQSTGNQLIYTMPSDAYFLEPYPPITEIDFGFIDGLHHFEQALRDFLNIEKYTHSKSVIIFDDVLPRNQEEASRTMCPGDWTGDVWKVTQALLRYRDELTIIEVDTQPTGTLMVLGFGGKKSIGNVELRHVTEDEYMNLDVVPVNVINRAYAWNPEMALEELRGFLL